MTSSNINFPKTTHQIASQSYQRSGGQSNKTTQENTNSFQELSAKEEQNSSSLNKDVNTLSQPQISKVNNTTNTGIQNLVQQIMDSQLQQNGVETQMQNSFNDHGFANKAYTSSMGLESNSSQKINKGSAHITSSMLDVTV